ncbi:MAG TPA: UvrD-helicase domain-containing protein, partial [Erysipelotrichaceae bacterium]|nr:UvrD-helicase domain-containing protein [Erysipelotrichaceae bacterium]
MDNIITRFFNRNKRKTNTKPIKKETTSNTEEFLSLTNFISSYPKTTYNDVKNWLMIKKYISKKKNEQTKEEYLYATNIGKAFGIKVNPIYKESVKTYGISLNRNAQDEIRIHFDSLDISSVIKDLKIDDPYFDKILSKVDPRIKLDKEQREVIVSKDKNTLVVAGAGAGKTTTMAAKVKYLVERQTVKPEEIIIVSYTNKAI